MKIHLLDTGGERNLIQSHTGSSVRIQETEYTSSLIVGPGFLVPDWPPGSIDTLEQEHIEALMEHGPELVLIGTGPRQHFPGPAVLKALINSGIGYEFMDTGAACRTFNILVAENRQVIAGLIL